MTKLIGLITVIVLFFFSFSRKKTFVPPGTIPINETFFADECEFSNLSCIEYEYLTAVNFGRFSKEHLATLPDTLVWRDAQAYNEPYVKYYYRHLAYRNYPVVGISHDQALAFCKWRTERVKAFYYLRYKKKIDINYRLPSEQEWEFLASIGPDVFSHNGKNKNKQALFNCLRMDDTADVKSFSDSNADVTAPIYSYSKNSFGLYNLAGNVAEMVTEKGICIL